MIQITPTFNHDGRTSFAELQEIHSRTIDMDGSLAHHLLTADHRLILFELIRPAIHFKPDPTNWAENEQLMLTCGNQTYPVPQDLIEIIRKLNEEELSFLTDAVEKRNGMVVEYNPLVASILGCNTNVSILGSATQAKSILHYLLSYVTKTVNDITECLPLIFHARRNAQLYPSVAEDTETDRRAAQLFVHKILNEITGRVEVSSLMAALCILGGEAEMFSDQFSYVFVTSAIRYVNEIKKTQAMIATELAADSSQK